MNLKKSVLSTLRVFISITFYMISHNILLDEKQYEIILVYNISYKTKPLRIRFDKIDGLISVYDRTRFLVFFILEKYDAIYYRIRYFIGVKNGITYVFYHNYGSIKVD